jgi:xanthine dehydrogenase molybdenum-binding subunit
LGKGAVRRNAVALVADEAADRRGGSGRIETSYEPLETVTNPVRAREDGAPLVHEAGNLLKHIQVRKGDIERGFEQADVILEDEYFTPTTEHAYMEPECSIARPVSGGRLEIYVGSQIPYSDRSQVPLA